MCICSHRHTEGGRRRRKGRRQQIHDLSPVDRKIQLARMLIAIANIMHHAAGALGRSSVDNFIGSNCVCMLIFFLCAMFIRLLGASSTMARLMVTWVMCAMKCDGLCFGEMFAK